MTKAQAIKRFGSAAALARALGISEAAVSQWPADRIPEKQELRLKYVFKYSRRGVQQAQTS